MSWQDTLRQVLGTSAPYTQYPQNPQNPSPVRNSADIADSAYRAGKTKRRHLSEALADACKGLEIKPIALREALATEDIADWEAGRIGTDTLEALARSLEQRRLMDCGKRPAGYTEAAHCRHCGPVWLWFAGQVLGCPWCWNRIDGKPIPRPASVQCLTCGHFRRTEHPHLGHCARGQPEAPCGLWDTDSRSCPTYEANQND